MISFQKFWRISQNTNFDQRFFDTPLEFPSNIIFVKISMNLGKKFRQLASFPVLQK